jgi:hypothetical protein
MTGFGFNKESITEPQNNKTTVAKLRPGQHNGGCELASWCKTIILAAWQRKSL